MTQSVNTFLMFQDGRAEEAITFYVSLIEGSEIISLVRYGPEGPGAEGSVFQAAFRLAGHACRAFDSPVKHAFEFTPSTSIFIDCDSEAEVNRLFAALSDGGQVMMPVGDYGFSRRFGWTNDRFGVSWQINMP
ncbi:MAG: VOC family protein [Phenylobacterium sp.]